MNEATTGNGDGSGVEAAVSAAVAEPPREKLTKKAITADHPTWCPGCGDFAGLASFYKVLEKRQLDHEKIVTLAGIGCSSRFPAREWHQPGPARSPRLPVWWRRRRVLHRRQPCRSRRAQEHQHDLFHHGQLRLWPDQKADLADVAHRFQEQ